MNSLFPAKIEISAHALERFKERAPGGASKSDKKAACRLKTWLANAEEVKLRKRFRVAALAGHGGMEARYFRYNQFIIVVKDLVVTTIHTGTAGRWK
jgi:hypothetical protein